MGRRVDTLRDLNLVAPRGRPAPAHRVAFSSAFRWWLKLGFINFGGPAGQIAIMHDELVERRRWISNTRFLHALNYCMLLPGPEAQQLAIYIGWLLNGTWGGVVAGVLFVLPAFFLIMALSWSYAVYGDVGWVAAVFEGLQPVVIAIVAVAVIKVGKRVPRSAVTAILAVGSFVAIFFVDVPFPLIVLTAAVIGVIVGRRRPDLLPGLSSGEHDEEEGVLLGADEIDESSRPTPGRNLRVLVVGLAVWWLPLLGVLAWRGMDDTLSREALFFSQTAMVTFGGAYAVLAYINQAAVSQFGWLAPGQMVAGLGLAESTPGPLIMVTQFVGFLGAYRFPGELDPVVAGILGGTVTVWATFAPCFLWIFLGAPYIERLRRNRAFSTALAAITAAVVGVILNLAATFALLVLFDRVERTAFLGLTFPVPDLRSIELFAALVTGAAFVVLWRTRVGVLWVILAGAILGLLRVLV